MKSCEPLILHEINIGFRFDFSTKHTYTLGAAGRSKEGWAEGVAKRRIIEYVEHDKY